MVSQSRCLFLFLTILTFLVAPPQLAGEEEPAAGWRLVSHQLTVELDPPGHGLRAEDLLTLAYHGEGNPPPLEHSLNRALLVEAVTLDGQALDFEEAELEKEAAEADAESVDTAEHAAEDRLLRVELPAGGKLTQCGKYRYLAFVDGENRDKGIRDPEDSPLVHRFTVER